MEVYEVKVHGNDSGGKYWEMVHHYNVTEDSTISPFENAQWIRDAFQTQVESDLQDLLPSQAEILGYAVRRVTSGGGPTATLAAAAFGTAADANNGSGNQAGVVNWYPDGSSNRLGRSFLPAIPSSDLQGDAYSSRYRVASQSWGTSMRTQLVQGGGPGTADLVIFHRASETVTPIVAHELSAHVGTQRRRVVPI